MGQSRDEPVYAGQNGWWFCGHAARLEAGSKSWEGGCDLSARGEPTRHTISSRSHRLLATVLQTELRQKRDAHGYYWHASTITKGHRVAQEMRCDRYAECSAVTGELMNEVCEDIAHLAVKNEKNIGDSGPFAGSCILMWELERRPKKRLNMGKPSETTAYS